MSPNTDPAFEMLFLPNSDFSSEYLSIIPTAEQLIKTEQQTISWICKNLLSIEAIHESSHQFERKFLSALKQKPVNFNLNICNWLFATSTALSLC